jgi:ubiquinone/menaquinone biosynthesis C-methylase UbiE
MKNPMTPSEAEKYYETEYYSGDKNTADNSIYNNGEQFRKKEADIRLTKLGNIKSLLDIGCGTGFFVKVASDKGIRATGVDISQNAVQYGKDKGLDLIYGDILYMDFFEKESFDAITMWASIEHLYYPKETLKKVHTLLKPDGLLVVETGDVNSYLSKLTKNKWRMLIPGHNFYYSSRTLDDLLKRTGFETVQTYNDGFIESIIAQIGLRDYVLEKFAESPNNLKNKSSTLKEIVNQIASKLRLGDVMIKHAKKSSQNF